jgi:hypothetical protein
MTIAHIYDTKVPNALYLQNFGGAHGHSQYKDAVSLINDITKILQSTKLLEREDGYFIYGMTNSNQGHARGLLKQAGFTTRKIGNLEMHSITDKEFATSAALAIEAVKKEEARLAAEKEAALKAQAERDKREGRKPGELRVGDVVWYYQHTPGTRALSHYVIIAPEDKNGYVGYQTASSFSMYSAEYLSEKGNFHTGQLAKHWERVDPVTDAAVTKRYPSILSLRK